MRNSIHSLRFTVFAFIAIFSLTLPSLAAQRHDFYCKLFRNWSSFGGNVTFTLDPGGTVEIHIRVVRAPWDVVNIARSVQLGVAITTGYAPDDRRGNTYDVEYGKGSVRLKYTNTSSESIGGRAWAKADAPLGCDAHVRVYLYP